MAAVVAAVTAAGPTCSHRQVRAGGLSGGSPLPSSRAAAHIAGSSPYLSYMRPLVSRQHQAPGRSPSGVLAVKARLGGLFKNKAEDKEEEEEEEEENEEAGNGVLGFGRGRRGTQQEVVKVAEKTARGTRKIQRTGGLVGTLKLLFGGNDTRPARELPRDDTLVFVAGSTGKLGSRAVRELVKQGFKVRAGARNVTKAEELLADLPTGRQTENFWAKILGGAKQKVLEVVPVDLEDEAGLEEAIGAAGKVVCAIGAADNDALNVTAPYKVDGQATKTLIRAATAVGVEQFVLISSLGTGKIGFPASLLNLFWGVLIWKAQAEKALIDSGMAFTIIRPGGMERPKDDYKETHNLRLAPANSLSGGQVSSLQVAELIATALEYPEASENKIAEAVAEKTAPLRPLEELLAELPVTGLTQAQRLEAARAQAEEEARLEEEREAAEAKLAEEARLEEERRIAAEEEKEALRIAAEQEAEARRQEEEQKRVAAKKAAQVRARLSKELALAREKEKEAQQEASQQAAQRAALEKRSAELRAKAAAAAQAATEAKALQKAVQAAAKEGRILSQEEKNAVLASVRDVEATVPPSAQKKKVSSKQQPSKEQLVGGKSGPFSRVMEVAKVAEDATAVAEDQVKGSAFKVLPEATKKAVSAVQSPQQARAAAEQKVAAMLAEQKATTDALSAATAKVKEEEANQANVAAKLKAKQEEEEKRVKAEAETKAKEEQERQARAAAMEKAKQEAQAREAAKVEEARKVQAAADAKAKQEAEEKKAKEEADAKAREEEAKKTRLEAEAKAKQQEEERKAAAAAEAKLKEDREKEAKARAKQEADERKAKAVASALAAEEKKREAETAIIAAAKEAEAAKRKVVEAVPTGFRWPWQRAPEPPAQTEPPASEQAQTQSSTDLLPRLPDLKPPSIPTPDLPIPASTLPEVPASTLPEVPASTLPEVPKIPRPKWVATSEGQGEPKQVVNSVEPTSQGFRWPWQEAEPEMPAPKSSTDLPYANRPLSPYTMFPDLRPPSSPSPHPPNE